MWALCLIGLSGLGLQAAAGLPAILILLLVMNWFFHRVYWTGWIAHHRPARRASAPPAARRRTAARAGASD